MLCRKKCGVDGHCPQQKACKLHEPREGLDMLCSCASQQGKQQHAKTSDIGARCMPRQRSRPEHSAPAFMPSSRDSPLSALVARVCEPNREWGHPRAAQNVATRSSLAGPGRSIKQLAGRRDLVQGRWRGRVICLVPCECGQPWHPPQMACPLSLHGPAGILSMALDA